MDIVHGDKKIDLAVFVESLGFACLVLDPALTILAASAPYWELANMPPALILGKNLRDLPDEFSTPLLCWSIEQVLKTRAPNTVAWRTPPNGEHEKAKSAYWQATNSLVLDQPGQITFVLVRIEDMTELSESRDEAKRSLEALAFQEKLFESFMDHTPACAWIKDQDGRILYVNDSVLQLFAGRKRTDIVGRIDLDWIPQEMRQRIHDSDRQVLQSRQIVRSIEQIPDSAGTPKEWLTIKFPIRRKHSTYLGAIGVDLALKKEFEHTQSYLASIVEHSQDAIIGQDMNGTITSWNRGATRLYGYEPEEVLGKNISFIHVIPESEQDLESILDQVRRGVQVGPYETIHLCKQLKEKNVSVSLSAVKNNGVVAGVSMIARDITSLKKAESKLMQVNAELKDRVYELAQQAAALQTARDQALEASNLKSSFCRRISHELRTPLSAILGLNELMMQSLAGEHQGMATTLHESAEGLLHIVNEILDISKLEAGQLDLQQVAFSVVDVLRECEILMEKSAKRKELKFQVSFDQSLPVRLYGDPDRLRQILVSLIGNAIKFTEHGSVSVAATLLNQSATDATIKFAVTDTGIGISPEDLRLLFQPFEQVDSSSTRKFGGTGLGLNIAQKLTEMMDGHIEIASEPGRGSTFSVVIVFPAHVKTVKRAPKTPVNRQISSLPANLVAGRRILVVEDNAVLQHLAMKQLKTLGVSAQATMSGEEAVTLGTNGFFDLILMDINLPDISGLEATVRIRDLENVRGWQRIPIIAMTAGAMTGDREIALAAGMDDYLAKPVSLEMLKDMLEKTFANLENLQRRSPTQVSSKHSPSQQSQPHSQ